MKKKPKLYRYRVDILGTSLQLWTDQHEVAKRDARQRSAALKCEAQVIQLLPAYAVLETYNNGEEQK